MRVDGNYGATTSYQPNAYDQWAEQLDQKEPPLELTGALDSYEPKADQTDDLFKYPGDLYRLMTEEQKKILIDNTARNMTGVCEKVRSRHAAHCYLADPKYGSDLAKALGLDEKAIIALSKLSHADRIKATSA
jgi:catalase